MSTATHPAPFHRRMAIRALYIGCSLVAWGLSFFPSTAAIAPALIGACSFPWSIIAIALGAGSVLPVASIVPLLLAGNLVNILLVLRLTSPRSA